MRALVRGRFGGRRFPQVVAAEAAVRAGRFFGPIGAGAGQGESRQLLGYESVADDFDVTGNWSITSNPSRWTIFEKKAVEIRPDLQAAHTGVKLANDTVSLAFGNRAKDWTWGGDYTYQSIGPTSPTARSAFRYPSIFRFTTAIRAKSRAAKRRSAVRRNGIVDAGGCA